MTLLSTRLARRLARRVVRGLSLALLAGAAAHAQEAPQQTPPPPLQQDKQDYSQAERLLFMGKALTVLKPPTTLRYSFRKSGSLEEGFEDKVSLHLKKSASGPCCAVAGEFMTGARRVQLPEIDNAEANPVLLYFLEHDVRDMERLTKGKQSYYRKRIRMAAYDSATLSELPLRYKGRAIRGQQVELSPYVNDPARIRFEKFARKTYQFLLSDAVPGGIYGIRTVMRGESAAAPPMIVEELYLDGAEPLPPSTPAAS